VLQLGTSIGLWLWLELGLGFWLGLGLEFRVKVDRFSVKVGVRIMVKVG